MNPFFTLSEFESQFGAQTKEADTFFTDTYPIFKRDSNGNYHFYFELEIFDESMDLFHVDPDMVEPEIELYPIFCNTEVDPDILSNFMDAMEEKVGYSGVNNSGYLYLTFSDIRKWYGDSFDKDMSERYSDYEELKKWMVEREDEINAEPSGCLAVPTSYLTK